MWIFRRQQRHQVGIRLPDDHALPHSDAEHTDDESIDSHDEDIEMSNRGPQQSPTSSSDAAPGAAGSATAASTETDTNGPPSAGTYEYGLAAYLWGRFAPAFKCLRAANHNCFGTPQGKGTLFVIVGAVVVFFAIFTPWYMVDVEPGYAIESRMVEAKCVVLNHTVVGTKAENSNTLLLYAPGIVVLYNLRGSAADAVQAVAMPRIEQAQWWMSKSVMDDYFVRNPVASIRTCYYDSDDPAGRTVMANGIDGLGGAAFGRVVFALLGAIASLVPLTIVAAAVLKC